jgi:Spy/CpxP family protein refolding chaperone
MDMKKQTLMIATLAIATLGWISTAAAQDNPGGAHPRGPGFGRGAEGPGGPGGPHSGMIAERLGLSDDQKASWKAIEENARTAAEPLMKAAGDARAAFEKALEADNADPASVGQLAIAMKSARKQLEAQHQATLEALKAILTPEQAAKFDEMQKRMRRGPGPDGPQGVGMRRRGPGELK